MKKQTIVIIALSILFALAAVQAVQINEIRTSIEEGAATASSTTTTSTQTSSPRSQPTMVGGC